MRLIHWLRRIASRRPVIEPSYQALLEAMPDLMLRLNRTGEILDVKVPPGTGFHSFAASRVGMKVAELQLPGIAEKFLDYIAQTLDKRTIQAFDIQLPGPTRSLAYEVRMVVCAPGEVLAIIRDVTEYSLAEHKLRYHQSLLQQAINIAGLGIWEWEIAPDVTTWSGEMFRIYGIAPESFAGKGGPYLDWTHPEDRQKQRENITQALLRAEHKQPQHLDTPVEPVEIRIVRPDGTQRTVLGDAVAITDSEGKPVRMVGILLDITERKRAEQQRVDLLLAEQKADLLRYFLANLSHDFKTPLSVINVTIHLLERLTSPDQQKQKFDTIKAQTLLLENLIQDIMTFSELNTVSYLVMKPMDLNSLVRDVETRFRLVAEQSQLALSLALAQDLPRIMANSEELNRALVQLVGNAIDYSEISGEIKVRTACIDSTVAIEVSDTGIGISPSDLPYIFDPFFRADKARASDTGRTGLGLTIVKKIVELHHGHISVQSVVGAGTTVRISLPLVVAPQDTPDGPIHRV